MDRWKAERGRVREKRRVEERRSEKRKSQKKEDADARKGRKVAKHCVFPMICGSGGSKSRLAKAAGAEPSGQMRDEKLHAVVARSTCRSQKVQSTPYSDHFWKLRCRKSARRCGMKHISKSKCTNHTMYGPILDVQISFRVAGERDCAPGQKRAKRDGFVAFPKTMTGVGHVKICKDVFSVAGAQYSSRDIFIGAVRRWGRWFPDEGLHFGASDLQVCWDDFAWQVQHLVRPGITFSWQAQYFRQVDWKNRKTHWYEAVSSALNFPFLKEVSQNCFVFDVVKTRRIILFRMQFTKWRSLAELLRFWCCQLRKMRKSRRRASFSSLQTDRQTDRQTGRQTDRQTEIDR